MLKCSPQHQLQNDNPKIQLVLNDGTVPYQHLTDGISQESGSCLKDFRNKPYPVKIRLVYLRGSLEVWVHEGVSLSDDDYELCLRVEPTPALAQIPKTVYFGVSAATGGLSDDHDVLSFLTYSVSTYEQKAVQVRDRVGMEEAKEGSGSFVLDMRGCGLGGDV